MINRSINYLIGDSDNPVVIYTFTGIVGTRSRFPIIFLPLHMIRPQAFNIMAHVAGWLLFFSRFVGFATNSRDNPDIANQLFSLQFLLSYFVFLFLFYFNVYVLIPQLYQYTFNQCQAFAYTYDNESCNGKRLPPGKFKRIHRSHIVATEKVRSVLDRKVKLASGTELAVSDS